LKEGLTEGKTVAKAEEDANQEKGDEFQLLERPVPGKASRKGIRMFSA